MIDQMKEETLEANELTEAIMSMLFFLIKKYITLKPHY